MLYMFCSLENLQEYLSLIPLVTIIQIHTLIKQWFWIVHYRNSYIYWWNFYQYLYYYFINNEFIDWITDGNVSSIKLSSVVFCLSVSPSVIKKIFITDGFTGEKSVSKFFLPASFRRYFPREACHNRHK
jgi:hypothetical protein